jgi:MSHA biogenesis protein MshQ
METIVMRKLFIIFSALLFLPALSDYAVRSGDVNDVTNGLIGWWKLDEESYDGTPGEVYDSSGNENHGYTQNNVKTNPGINGRAFYSTGNGYRSPIVIIPHNESLILMGDFSISLWFYPFGNDGSLIIKRTNANGTIFSISFKRSGNNFRFIHYYHNPHEGGFANSRESGNIPFSCRWMHFIFVKQSGIFSMYLDGVFFFTVVTVYPGFENFANINIGACQIVDDSLNTYSPFYGCIDDVRIYNHALSSNEISQIYKTSAENHGACLHG